MQIGNLSEQGEKYFQILLDLFFQGPQNTPNLCLSVDMRARAKLKLAK